VDAGTDGPLGITSNSGEPKGYRPQSTGVGAGAHGLGPELPLASDVLGAFSMKHLFIPTLAFCSLGALPHAQTPDILLKAGDPLSAGGAMQRPRYVAIGDSGAWVSLIESDEPDPNRDVLLFRSGFLVLREGMNLPQPAGTTLDDWGSIHVNAQGDLGMHLRPRTTATTIDGLYWNHVLVQLEGDVLDFAPFSAGATLDGVRVVRLTEERELVALVKVLDPTLSSRPVDALIRYTLGPTGDVLARTTLAAKNTFNNALGAPVDTLGTATNPEHSLAVNQQGDFVLPVNGIGARAILVNMDRIVARELDPSPVAGRTWNANAFALSKVDINDHGEIAFTGTLAPLGVDPTEPTNFLIVKDGQKFAQSGDVLPALSNQPLAKGTSRVAISNRGNVFWRAQVVAGGAAFMIDQTPLLQEGVTVVEGHLVSAISGSDDCFAISPEGRYFLGRVQLQGIGEAVVYLDLGLIRELEGCLGLNQGTLRQVSGAARVGQSFRVAMDGGPAPGAAAFLLFSRRSSLTAAGCGQFTAHGELMLAQPAPDVLFLPPWGGTNPSELDLAVPNSLALVDATFFLQGMFGIPGRLRTYRLTNALELQIGPP